LSISLSNIDRLAKFFHWRILWKICNKAFTKHTTTLVSLHYLLKYKICKIHYYLVNIWTRVWSLILAHPVRQYRLLMFTNTESLSKTKHNLTFRMGQKIKLQLLFSSSPNTDGFYTFYISQGSVATQLRCGGMFSNHFTKNFSQNAAVKKFWKSVIIWQRYGQNFVAYFFGPPCSFAIFVYMSHTSHMFRSHSIGM